MNSKSLRWPALAVFVLTALLLAAYQGHRVVLTNDEGILLEAAQRMTGGQRPYVDFFGYMSPGSYWIQALMFRCLGISLFSGRVVVLFDLALQCALLFWLTARFSSKRAAGAAVLFFFVFQTADPSFLTAQHRWDSATLALLSMVLCLEGVRQGSRLSLLAGGVASAMAAFCTPSVGLVALVTVGWLVSSRERRVGLPPYLAGAALTAVSAFTVMHSSGILAAFVDQMRWLRGNYSTVNVMPYGAIIGGYRALFEGAGVADTLVRFCLVLCIALPAILPVALVLAWLYPLVRGRVSDAPAILYLIACVAALTLATLPRPDVMHLAFAVAPAYALSAIWISRYLTPHWTAGLFSFLALWAAVFAYSGVAGLLSCRRLDSPVGRVLVQSGQEPAFRRLLATVRRNDSLFVYPYLPVLYFITQSRNPTRYSFLAPGMMTSADEHLAAEELSEHPPQWILFLPLNREEFLRVWPAGTKLNYHFTELEQWIAENYGPVAESFDVGGYQLLECRGHAGGGSR